MIHIVIGTKAELIKMLPVIIELEKRNISFNVINFGQHGETIKRFMVLFDIKSEPTSINLKLYRGKDISSVHGLFLWSFVFLCKLFLSPKSFKKKVLNDEDGVVLVHGDTLSALLGVIMAKRLGYKLAHIESGLRSWDFFDPFPEEIIRTICMKSSDYLFAPSKEAEKNLTRMRAKGKVFNLFGNTGMEAVETIFENRQETKLPLDLNEPFVLVSIHRFENLYSTKRLNFIMDTVIAVSRKIKVVFVMHGPTKRRLKKKGLLMPDSREISFVNLQDYTDFLSLIDSAEFVVADGGSIQEECAYLGKPCLVMRKRTERPDGIGENVVVGEFDKNIINSFIENYKKYKKNKLTKMSSPSHIIVGQIGEYA